MMSIATFIDFPEWLVFIEIIARSLFYTGIGFSLIVFFMIRGIEFIKGV
jgi:hypothetical protein